MINPSDFENERVIWREQFYLKPFMIPDGFDKCPKCDGRGKVIKLYKNPGPNEYITCFNCDGKGYVPSFNQKNTTEKTSP